MDEVWPMMTKDVVHTGLQLQLKTSFADGIKRLANCYTICFEKRGDYAEKGCSLHLSQIVQEISNTITLCFDSTSKIADFF